MGAFDREQLRTTYRKSVFWSTLFFAPTALCIMAANVDVLTENWIAVLLVAALVLGLLTVGFGYPALRIVFFEARRHREFADELWQHNIRRAGLASWIVGFFAALVIANIELVGGLDLSGAVASGLIALLMMVSLQMSIAILEWRAET